MKHWAAQYINKPWQRGARGPGAYDCFGLVHTVLRDHYGITLHEPGGDYSPRMFMEEIDARAQDWVQQSQPADGDVCVMGRSRIPVHIGIIVDDNGLRCLHSVEPSGTLSGVIAQRLLDLRLTGWGRVQFYRHKTRCN